MNRVVLVVVLLGCVLVGAGVFYLRVREPAPAPVASVAAPAPSPTPAPPAPSPSAAPSAAPAPAKTAPARKARPAPAPAEPTPPPAPTSATLRIVADVPGAQVFLNRQFVGTAPATAADLAPGEYQLNVSAPGYDNHVETITLEAGEREVSVAFRVVRLDAALDVIHKHRFGSCRGRLIATPEGLRYETTDKDDAFRAALLDLETFQVDYLNKNLRIQPRKGRRYDFTDPDGNADRLFVFHRDVERAREQLKKEG